MSRTQQQAMFIAIFIIAPSILRSGFTFPLEAVPKGVRVISYALPFTYFVDIIRGLLKKQTHLSDLLPSFMALTAFLPAFVPAFVLAFVLAFVGVAMLKFRKAF
ncbi:MAG: ABC-type multidrug transport system permease subunit [Kiritimatiellia bacterium]